MGVSCSLGELNNSGQLNSVEQQAPAARRSSARSSSCRQRDSSSQRSSSLRTISGSWVGITPWHSQFVPGDASPAGPTEEVGDMLPERVVLDPALKVRLIQLLKW